MPALDHSSDQMDSLQRFVVRLVWRRISGQVYPLLNFSKTVLPGSLSFDPREAPRRLDGIQAGRAIAALAVVLFHANVYILPHKLHDGAAAATFYNAGYTGVEYFFVLSGFIMFHVHRRDIGHRGALLSYAWKRFVRIFPIYWLVLISLFVVTLIVPGIGSAELRDPLKLLGSALLLPWPPAPALEVAWTLRHELLFYAVFALALVSARWGLVVLASWTIACIGMSSTSLGSHPLGYLLSPYNVLFSMGIAGAVLFRQFDRTAGRIMIAIGVLGFIAIGQADVQDWMPLPFSLRTWLLGLCAAITIAGIAAAEPSVPRVMARLGDSSYLLYLIHVPAMSVVARLLAAAGGAELPPDVTIILVVAAAVVVAHGLHVMIEAPLLRHLSRRMSTSRAPAAPPVHVMALDR
ncbi:acyltransferase [Paracoccus sp. MC1862]|uniref:acyltransferase family protein n=1 Tax=Paracoccus sp. MC1862 TaxID=2760307 RepID=UPI0016023FA0|nr:acyltransferase [Paracoccus sp. MC1862]MBB1498717.1 acyltransferase [Paracoccus sp. MC1862]QQO45600.1 acyltransferase [Paracoccus sp. MC1862]